MSRDEHDAQLDLDGALARLSRADLDPFQARAQLSAAQRRLAQPEPALTRLERCEPWLLWAVSAAQLAWAIARVVSGAF